MYFQMLREDTVKYIMAEDFLETPEEIVTLLLEQDELNIESELVLVKAVVSWAQCEAQRRGLEGNDADVRKVLKPRLLSLLRLTTLTTEEFMSGPGFENWLTPKEKWDITSYHYYKHTNLPTTVSNTLEERRQPLSYRIFYSKRNKISREENLLTFDYNFFLNVHCVFRVKSNCCLLGILILSQVNKYEDHTKLSDEPDKYKEKLNIAVLDWGDSLSRSKPVKKMGHFQLEDKVHYNSCIQVMFPIVIPLTTESWFSINIIFEAPGEYPNFKRSEEPCHKSKVEFVVHADEQPGYQTSFNDGVIEAMVFSL
jgi:hypothetical protein